MPGHRRGRSLSEGLMLEESEKGGLVVSSVIGGSSGNQGLKEGDEIVGATINFDQLSKDDVLKILKLMDDNGFDEKVQVLTKNNLSKSMGTLDSVKAPEEMLKDSYNRLYNAKINRFMKDDSPGQPAGAGERGSHNGQVKGKGPRPLWGKPKVKGDLKPPVLTMDYPVVETHKVDAPTYLESPDLKFSAQKLKVPKLDVNGAVPDARGGELSLPNTNISTSDLSLPHLNGSLNIDAPSVNLERPYLETDIDAIDAPEFDMSLPKDDIKGPNLDLKVIDPLPKVRGDINVPEAELNLPEGVVTGPTLNINTPKLDNERTGKMFKMPKFGPSVNVPSLEVGTPNMRIPDKDMPGVNLKGPQLDLQSPDVNLKGPNLDLQAPDVSMMNMPSSKIRVRSSKKLKNPNLDVDDPSGYFELPKVRLSRRVPKGPDLDIDAVLKTQDMHLKTSLIGAPDLNVPDVDLPSVDIKGSKIDLELPDANIGIPSGKIKTPSLGMADFDISGPRVRTPDLDRSADEMCLSDVCLPDLSTPDIGITSGKFKLTKPHAELKAPDFNVDAPSGKLKMPKFGFSGLKRPDLGIDADVKTPKLSLKAPKIKGGLDAPDLDLPKVDLKSPKLDANTPDIDIDAPSGKFKVPTFKMPKCTLSGPRGPEFGIDGELDGPDLSLSSSKLKQPDVDVGSPSGKFKMPIFKMPDFGFSGPDVQGPDFEVKNPNLDLSAPKFKGGISHPDLDLPDVDLKGPKLDLNAPDVNFNMPSGKVKVPTLKKPKVDLNAPDLDGPSGNLKMPKFGLSGKMPKSLKLNLKAPKMKGGINFPDADLKSAKLDMTAPDLDINAPSGKFKMPKFRGLKGPNVDINGAIEGPDLNLSSPKLKGPKAHLNIPDIPHIDSPSGKFKMPTFKMPHLGLSGPKVKGPDLDLSAPKFKGGISHPDLDLPDVDLKGPKLDLNAPDVNFNMPSGKVKVPTLKKPKVDLNAPDLDIDGPSGHLKMPKFGLSGKMPKSPKLNLKAPKMKGGIDFPDLNLPDADLKAAKLDMTAPDLDINAPTGKFKMPKFRGLKGPNVDINGAIEGPDMNLSSPKLKGPKADLNIPDADIDSPSGKFKMPTFKMPHLGVSGPKVKGPDLDLSAPRFKGGISHPDLDLPDVDLKGPKLDLNAPDVHFNMPSGKVKVPTFKKPKVDLNAPDLDIDDTSGHLKMPKFGLSGKMPKSPKLNLKAPKMKAGIDFPDLNLPDADLKAAKLDMTAPDLDINAPTGKFKMPKFRGLKGPNVDINGAIEGPDMNLSSPKLKGPKADLNIPDADIDSPSGKFKMPTFKMPDLGLSGPKVKGPDLDLSAPRFKGGISHPDLDLPDVDLKGPKLDLNAPDVNFNMPSGKVKVPTLKKPTVDLNAPDLDIDDPSGHLKMPKFGLSGKMPKSTKMNLKAPKIKGGIDSPDMNVPDADLKAPKLDVNTPDLYINAPSGKFKMPKFKMPKFRGLKRPDVDIDGDLDGTEKDINAPIANLKGPKTGLKIPDLKMPDFGLSGPNVDAPDYDLPDIDLSAPKLKGGISPPDLRLPKDHLRGPKLDLNAPDMPSGRFRVPTIERQNGSIKTPGFDISTPTFKMPEMPKFMLSRPKRPDQDISADIGLKLSKMKGGIGSPDLDLPTVDLEAPKIDVDTPDMNIDSPSGNFKMPHLKMPKFSLSGLNGPDAGIDGDIDGPDLSLSAPKVNTGIGSPDLDINVPSGNLNGPQADLNLPDSDIAIQSRKFELQSFKLPQFGSPNLRAGTDMDFMKTHDISPPKAKVDLKAPDLKVSHPDVSLSLPKADIRGPEYKVASHSKRRSDIPGVAHLKLQAMDIDTEETLPHTDSKSRKVKGRVSYPIADIDLPKVEYEASGLELRGSDLNDPTGKLKIPKSKTKLGSHTRIPDLDVDSSLASINASVPKLPQPGYGVEVSQTDLNLSRTDFKGNKHHRKAPAGETGRTKRRSPKQSEIVMSMPNCTHGSNPKMSEDQEAYFVTAFPKHVKGDVPDGTGSLKNRHKEESNRRSQTLRSLDFSASNVDLEVPEDENLKGSTFWLSKLI
ncbi:neuroblast differentiation-associated protein AHNAK isoform X2 [Oncorhynchus mykiss]|uniref:neuroblast differentiation-associated protein AHNAK isoform X2 n=1 Tax=Oncorhynchus mykiss TaxID=8022 RepID=UPI0018781F02|nr:neuroblast differentiation-associated protein AHNAK isoform X2 [Oncorhynchus mykiss]